MDDVRPPQQQKTPSAPPSPSQPVHPVNAVPPVVKPEPKPNPVAQTPVKKHSTGIGKWILGSLVVVLFGILMAMLWVKWTEADSAQKELTAAQEQLRDAQDDNAKLQQVIKNQTEAEKATTPKTTTPAPTQTNPSN